MHMITACDGGMPLGDALAAFFFMLLHDKVEHNCLIKKASEEHEERVRQVANSAKSLDDATMVNVFGLIGSSGLVLEEWSYLDDEDTFVFYLLADSTIEQVQRWISEGSHTPYTLPHLGGEIVQRPQWAIEYFGTPDSPKRCEARAYVKGLLDEVEDNRTSTPTSP